MVKCKKCGENKKIIAKGLCNPCYSYLYREKTKDRNYNRGYNDAVERAVKIFNLTEEDLK